MVIAALVIGTVIVLAVLGHYIAQDQTPAHLSERDWERISHPPHSQPFRRQP